MITLIGFVQTLSGSLLAFQFDGNILIHKLDRYIRHGKFRKRLSISNFVEQFN